MIDQHVVLLRQRNRRRLLSLTPIASRDDETYTIKNHDALFFVFCMPIRTVHEARYCSRSPLLFMFFLLLPTSSLLLLFTTSTGVHE